MLSDQRITVIGGSTGIGFSAAETAADAGAGAVIDSGRDK